MLRNGHWANFYMKIWDSTFPAIRIIPPEFPPAFPFHESDFKPRSQFWKNFCRMRNSATLEAYVEISPSSTEKPTSARIPTIEPESQATVKNRRGLRVKQSFSFHSNEPA